MDFRALPDGPVRLVNLTAPGWALGAEPSLVPLDLALADGRIVADVPDAPEVDMARAMVFPAFVDMHTHLDKGHIWPRTQNPDGTFDSALAFAQADRAAHWTADDLRARMTFSLRTAYAHGTRAIRTHLDHLGPDAAISWAVFDELRSDWSDRIDLQAAVLTGTIMADDLQAVSDTADLVARYGGVLGSCPVPMPNVAQQIEVFFRSALDRGLPLDFHVDETMDPGVNTLQHIAEAAIRLNFDNRVVVGHCCSLSTMPEDEAARTLDLVAQAGIHVVSLPMCNLYLQDRHAGRTPRNRGITLVHEIKARSIPISFASDNTRDPFYAYGDMDMLEVMREATRIGHLDHADPDWSRACVATPAESCGFAPASLAPGAPADLVIFRAREWTELFSRPQSDRIVLRGGRAIDRTLPDYAELDSLLT